MVRVVDGTCNQGPVRVTLKKLNNDLLADARPKVCSPGIARPLLSNPNPAGAGLVVFAISVPVELHPHTPEFVQPTLFAEFNRNNCRLRTRDGRLGSDAGWSDRD